jgi:hypothetical protein
MYADVRRMRVMRRGKRAVWAYCSAAFFDAAGAREDATAPGEMKEKVRS